jgi:hypothetical protein
MPASQAAMDARCASSAFAMRERRSPARGRSTRKGGNARALGEITEVCALDRALHLVACQSRSSAVLVCLSVRSIREAGALETADIVR